MYQDSTTSKPEDEDTVEFSGTDLEVSDSEDDDDAEIEVNIWFLLCSNY